MLDDQNVLKQRDPKSALAIAASEPDQLTHEFTVDFEVTDPIYNVVLAGMGGSAFPAAFVQTWPGTKVPFEICRGYTLPSYVNKNTLVIISSFSGNTEETLSALEDAHEKKAQIIAQANGGKLAQMSQDYQIPFVQIPNCEQPRMAWLYFYKAILSILAAVKVVDVTAPQELAKCADFLRHQAASLTANVPTDKNLAKQLALEMAGKTSIVYGGSLMAPAAQKWKICINENAKNTAWWNAFPEMCHNEFVGWSSHPVEKPFAVIDLFSNLEHERIKKRFDLADRLLSGKRPKAIRVEARGRTVLEQLLYLSMLADFSSIYLAILNGVDPTPVDLVEKLKKELG